MKDIHWLVEMEFMVFGLGCYMKGRHGWQTSQMDHTNSREARPLGKLLLDDLQEENVLQNTS